MKRATGPKGPCQYCNVEYSLRGLKTHERACKQREAVEQEDQAYQEHLQEGGEHELGVLQFCRSRSTANLNHSSR